MLFAGHVATCAASQAPCVSCCEFWANHEHIGQLLGIRRLRVIISMLVMCNASDVTEYNRRALELSNAQLHMKQDTTSIEI